MGFLHSMEPAGSQHFGAFEFVLSGTILSLWIHVHAVYTTGVECLGLGEYIASTFNLDTFFSLTSFS